MTKRDLQNFVDDLKALMRRRDRIAKRWMLVILLMYFIGLMAEFWFLAAGKEPR